uniref:Helicase-primase primase subunit n=1 Tax=Equid alphaherpesvirus 4 TaxID=10331 RepID=A0A0X8DDN5_9ALPH|nr:helicase-primase primase subunit [Equid alphaherpesvirus 4]
MALNNPNPTIRVLYATDSCVITYSLMLLTGQESSEDAYVISYDWSSELDDLFGSQPRVLDADVGDSWDTTDQSDEELLAAALLERKPSVSFCLLSGIVGGASDKPQERIRPMFVCAFLTLTGARALTKTLLHGHPISSKILLQALVDGDTFQLHNDLILALAITLDNATARTGRTAAAAKYDPQRGSVKAAILGHSTGRPGLTSVYIHHENKVLTAFRRLYSNNNTTPFWFTSKFGPGERELVLATRYYLFQAIRHSGCGGTYDLQATKDFIKTYNVPCLPNPTNLDLTHLTSFARLSQFCCQSWYARGPSALALPRYVDLRIQADVSEVSALEEFIAADRQGLRVSDREFITYIYLAHFESFNRRQLYNHLLAVSISDPADIERITSTSSLKRGTIEKFFAQVRIQLNIIDYIAHNVSPEVVRLPVSISKQYVSDKTYTPSSTMMFAGNNPLSICDTSTQMLKLLDRVETSLAGHGWIQTLIPSPKPQCITTTPPLDQPRGEELSPGVPSQCGISRRLLNIASSQPIDGRVLPLEVLFGQRGISGPTPVYRVALPSKRQAFAVIANDRWETVTQNMYHQTYRLASEHDLSFDGLSQMDDYAMAHRDLQLMRDNTGVCRAAMASSNASLQMYINRNEIFNSSLAVSNIILDVDFDIKKPIPLGMLHLAMRGFRNGIITTLSLIFTEAVVQWDSYPCYFYKTQCPPQLFKARTKNEHSSLSNYVDCVEEYYMESNFLDDYAAMEEYTYDLTDDYEMIVDDNECAQAVCDFKPQNKTTDKTPLQLLLETNACQCTEKMGFRITVPVPPPYILAGPEALRGVARIIQQAVVLERTFTESMCSVLRDFSFLDTGVYSHGRSLRLPFFCKVGDSGEVYGGLYPFYVVPKNCNNVNEFIAEHSNPANFHFHASPRSSTVTHVITNLGGDYVSFFERKVARNREAIMTKRATLEFLLSSYNVSIKSNEAVEAFVVDVVLCEVVLHLSAHFPNHAGEYHTVGVHTVVTKPDWILLQINRSGSAYRSQGFSCLRAKHLRSARGLARTFLSISADAHGRLCASISQQCFATKCGNNKMCTIFTLEVNRAK